MKLEEGLEQRQKEIIDLEDEIKIISADAESMKETVHKYNKLKQKESELKKLKRKKENDFKLVVGFFQNTEEHYLDKVFPLFKENQDSNKREEVKEEAENGGSGETVTVIMKSRNSGRQAEVVNES